MMDSLNALDEIEMMLGIYREKVLFMWGYLPGLTPNKLPLLAPFMWRTPPTLTGDRWMDVCGGGCGFAMAISVSGKVLTWGSTPNDGQSHIASGNHETPQIISLLENIPIIKGACGWAHCVTITDHGEVYAWGWKECVPLGKLISDGPDWVDTIIMDPNAFSTSENFLSQNQFFSLGGQDDPGSCSGSYLSQNRNQPEYGSEYNIFDCNSKKRRILEEPTKTEVEYSSAIPCLVSLGSNVQIMEVAAGGRHVLALSDFGKVWGWGYGGEGQLGLGFRITSVSAPQLIPCFKIGESSTPLNMNSENMIGSIGRNVKTIACGGRHSAVITDTGALLTFGWGLHGQCGHGGTDDELSPKCVSSILGLQMKGVAAGLWHTICTSLEGGSLFAFGGNGFGQLGIGSFESQTVPMLVDAPSVQSIDAKIVSCGARHNAITSADGKVFCWGWNKYGQLGLGDIIDRSSPCEVPINGFFVKKASCGWWHTLVIAESCQ